jgi:peroxiredoxin
MEGSQMLSTNTQINFQKLNTVHVLDQYGGEVALSSFWKSKPAILVFLRSFDCPACRGYCHDVWSKKDQYQANGSRIVFIGNGDHRVIEDFKKELNIQDAPIYTDPSRESFKVYGYKKVTDPYSEGGMKNIEAYQKRGFKIGTFGPKAGDGVQLGGIIVIKPGNLIAYHYISEVAGDYPEFIQS